MAFLEVLAQLFHPKPTKQPTLSCTRKLSAPPAILDCRPQDSRTAALMPGCVEEFGGGSLGVKYSSKYGWHICPPPGWRRQENHSSLDWPDSNSSPTVTFVNTNLKAPEQALIRWTLLCLPSSAASHDKLQQLLSEHAQPLTADSLKTLEAPGLVAGMKVQTVKLIKLSDQLPALLVQARLNQCQGEPLVLRYVLILPDRCTNGRGELRWYRESLQFTATENSFWANESMALRSLTSFHSSEARTALSRSVVTLCHR